MVDSAGQKANPTSRWKIESIYWPQKMIEIIKKVMNVLCKTPHPQEFVCELSEAAAAHKWEILKKCNNDLAKVLIANENTPLDYRSEFWMPQDSIRSLVSTTNGPEWNSSSEMEANGHWRKSEKRIGNETLWRCTHLWQPQRHICSTGTTQEADQ